ncbi:aminotransferase class I/II-fold pyridoxal phosphate-dependent enzyme [Parageobacillus thermoglucosidasius]|uniref:aminotransferase class I/II-fold pyridoxal phosphate-dependent enzyme n=1 Tax=Parageobacillus thermoglucosidasius TaxID=1426 RepID=UPI000E1A8A43|nr:aminotransferase class I/II-fold pyridoxal phosphate-dependent enzyme [Parageobacillus thermoglucosidasius]RDE36277.1 aminotransferase class I/II-fold pyridoxal phosphate-dependent enzyme [Parageobacillus thermoglucosidasius]
MEKIPFMRPSLVKFQSYKKYIQEIDKSQIYTNYGPLNNKFEERILSEYFDHVGAVTTVSNATLGLILAISETKRPKGKYAVMPSFTFSATPLAAMWCGLEPYFIDINEDDWFMNQEQLEEVLNQLGDEVAVVVPYATFGNYLDLSYYQKLHESGIPVVLDAAPCFGTTYNGQHIGQGFKGTVVFSFHATKSFGIGEGGLVYSQDEELIKNIRTAANFGYYGKRESITLGINAKMSEYFAAIGLATLDVYQEKILKREQLYNVYLEEITNAGLFEQGWQVQKTRGKIPFQFFSILCPKDELNTYYLKKLEEKNIQAVSYFSPACHQQKQFLNCPYSDLSTTNEITKRVLSLPFWEDMSRDIVRYIVGSLIS